MVRRGDGVGALRQSKSGTVRGCKENLVPRCSQVVQKSDPVDDEYSEFILKECDIPCIEKHWINKKPTIRINLDDSLELGGPSVFKIKFLDNQKVTEEDLALFQKIKRFVYSEIFNNEENLLTHEWNQGDIVLVDLFRMAHAVFGGFYPEEREFSGYWAYRDEH